MGATEESIAAAATAEHVRTAEQLRLARRAISDTLAIGVMGTRSRQVGVVRSTIAAVAPTDRLTAPTWDDEHAFLVTDAAMLAGTSTHSADWDDFMHPMHGHCSAVLLGALWPLAEALDATMDDLLDAFLVGYHVDWLTSAALSHAHYRRGWHATSTIGAIGAAAAAGRLLKLSTSEAAASFAVASSRASGIRVNFGTTTKALHGGFAARAGVEAALFARAGGTGSADWLLGPAGMLEVFGAEFDAVDAAQEVANALATGHNGIETEWGLVQKPYACCGGIHGAVDALLEVLSRDAIDTAAIESIIVRVDPLVTSIMRHASPADEQEARYSPSWVIAAAASDREAGPAQFSAEAIQGRQDIHDLRERVRIIPNLRAGNEDRFGAIVTVVTAESEHSAKVSHASGHPLNPMSDAQLAAKRMIALKTVLPLPLAEDLDSHVATLAQGSVRTLGRKIRSALAPVR